MRTKKIFILIVVLLIVQPLASVTVKIGSIAPAKSPWDKALRELGREWKAISNGQVKVKVYPGGIAGSEDDMIRKMKVGTLGGAVFTNRGLTKIYSDYYVLNVPFIFASDEEFQYVIRKMEPFFEKGIEKKGYKVIIWSMAGWIHFFSKDKVEYPDDLKKHKLSFATGEPELEQVWKKSGYQVIPNDISDLMMGLQSGMVNAFYLPPLVTASGQYFPLAPNMLSLKIAPIYGGIVLSNRIWKRIPEKYREEFMNVAQKISKKLQIKTKSLEKNAVKIMQKHGLKINPLPNGGIVKWREAMKKGMDSLINNIFSQEIYNKVKGYINDIRQKKNAE